MSATCRRSCAAARPVGVSRAVAEVGRRVELARPGPCVDPHVVSLQPRAAASAGDLGRGEELSTDRARTVHDPFETCREPELHGVRVVGGHRARRQRLDRRAHTLELTEGDANLVDDMRPVRTEPAAALGVVLPPRRELRTRIGERRNLQHEHRQLRRADRSLRDRTRQVCLTGGKTELGTEQMHHSRPLGGLRHGAGLGRVGRKWLLADDVLARRDRLERDRCVGVGRRCDRHDVDARERQCTRQRVGRIRDIEHAGSCGRFFLVATDKRVYFEPGCAQRPQMGDHAESCPHDCRTQSHICPIFLMPVVRRRRRRPSQ